MTLEQIMRRVQKKAGGGRIAVTLAASGKIYAHAYRTPEQVQTAIPDKIVALGKTSVSLAELDEIREELGESAIAYGEGADIAAALGNLAGKLK